MKNRYIATIIAVALAVATLSTAPVGASQPTATTSISNAAEFAAAVEAANAESNITRLTFTRGAKIELTEEVRYTGTQNLTLVGRNATLSGATASADTDTWDSGLFVSESAGDLNIRDLTFADSFNNGLAVFLPEGQGSTKVQLVNVTVTNAQFHGVLIDGQATTGYNTDGFIHPNCVDPYPVDSGETVIVNAYRSAITGAGQLDGYDISQATGCPQDFDGLRVDQGGNGDLRSSLVNSNFDQNLADGVELDEKGAGSVISRVTRSTFNNNGDTATIECTLASICEDDLGEQIEDLDDGFDIDEEDAGNLTVTILRSEASDNFDEGFDMDEAGDGNIVSKVRATVASRNGDEGYKASDADAGDNSADIRRSTFEDAGNDQIEIESEDGDGSGEVFVNLVSVTSTGADGSGVKAVEDDGGSVVVRVWRSTLTNNGEWGVEAEGGSGYVKVTKNSDVATGNVDGDIELDI